MRIPLGLNHDLSAPYRIWVECDGVNGKFLCKSAIPDYETREINFGVLKDGNLIFNPDSPRDHKQMTLIDEDQE